MSQRSDALQSKPEDCKYSFFSHRECEFFPCHPGADPENFNCLFCYCPLYALGRECGGNFRILENGIKDCTNCLLPHGRASYSVIVSRFGAIVAAMRDLERARREQQKQTDESGQDAPASC